MYYRLVYLSWLALCVFCITLRAGAFGILDGDSNAIDQSLLKKGQGQVLSDGQRDEKHAPTPPASPEVAQALQLLRPLSPKISHLTRRDKNNGVLATTLYYAKELFTLLFMNSPSPDSPSPRKLPKPLSQAIHTLQAAAHDHDPDAIFLLAEMNFFGNYTHPRNYTEAFHRYHALASLNGNASAQHMLGFMYATGYGGAVERDQAKALMYHTFASMGGSTESQMTAAFRHHMGIGTPRNCNQAAHWYKKVADKAVAYSRSGPPGGQGLQRDAYKVADEIGGVYGEGASVVSSGAYANKGGPNSDAHASFEDVIEYLDLMSRKGDLKATFSLGRIHYDGQRGLKRNLRTARAYFMTVARKYWQKDGSIRDDDDDLAKIASKAAGYVGRMFLRGEGMEQSFDKALTWFRRGVRNGDALCHYEMGIMHLQGLGVRKDALLAADYFRASADQDFSSGHVHMGKLFLDQGNVNEAVRHFDLAARHGHIEAFYHLAEINNQGIGRERSCGIATAYYKLVAEKTETIHSSFDEANFAYEEGDIETALPLYMRAAEQGYESAQANVAYILDEYKSIISLDSLIPWKKQRSSLMKNAVLALIYWTRSAKQSNIDSMVKMGDYYLGGWGVEADMEKAATCYQAAAESHQSAQALWNLGWIHENGMGAEQDFHLAKRFYDQALETNQESYLPVKLALIKLRVRSFWNTITNGKVNSIRSEPDLPKEWNFSEWLMNFLDEGAQELGDSDDADYYTNPTAEGMPGGDDDYYDDIDESIVESVLILGLMAALAALVYYRNQRLLASRRRSEEEQQQQQQQQQQQPTAPVAQQQGMIQQQQQFSGAPAAAGSGVQQAPQQPTVVIDAQQQQPQQQQAPPSGFASPVSADPPAQGGPGMPPWGVADGGGVGH